MSKSNQVYLNQMFSDVSLFLLNAPASENSYNYHLGYSNGTTYYPKKAWEYIDWDYLNTYTFKCTSDFIPSYPKSSYGIDKNGTSIIQIAITGFSEDEITIEKVESKIIVKGKKKESQSDEIKYIYKEIAERDFELEFQGSDSWDYSKIEAEVDKGILIIKIPVKEDCKPIEIKINKK